MFFLKRRDERLTADKEMGSTKVSSRADLTLIGIGKPHAVPWTKAPVSLVLLASGYDVNAMVTDGDIGMEKPGNKDSTVNDFLNVWVV